MCASVCVCEFPSKHIQTRKRTLSLALFVNKDLAFWRDSIKVMFLHVTEGMGVLLLHVLLVYRWPIFHTFRYVLVAPPLEIHEFLGRWASCKYAHAIIQRNESC